MNWEEFQLNRANKNNANYKCKCPGSILILLGFSLGLGRPAQIPRSVSFKMAINHYLVQQMWKIASHSTDILRRRRELSSWLIRPRPPHLQLLILVLTMRISVMISLRAKWQKQVIIMIKGIVTCLTINVKTAIMLKNCDVDESGEEYCWELLFICLFIYLFLDIILLRDYYHELLPWVITMDGMKRNDPDQYQEGKGFIIYFYDLDSRKYCCYQKQELRLRWTRKIPGKYEQWKAKYLSTNCENVFKEYVFCKKGKWRT